MEAKWTLYPDQINGVNLKLLNKKAEECERNILHIHFSKYRTTLFNQLNKPTNKIKLDDLKKKGILKNDQYLLLFPSSGKTDSSKFDMTLLSLLVRSLCGYQKPPKGWNTDPDVTDESEIADSVRFTLSRNRSAHFTQAGISMKEYKGYFFYLKDALKRRGCSEKDLIDMIRFKSKSVPTNF